MTVFMLFLALIVFGLRAYSELPLNLLPELSYPTLTVEVDFPGTAPAEMESLVAEPLEEGLATVPNLQRLSSVSRVGRTTLTLEFGWNADMDLSVLDVREKLDRVDLPHESDAPRVLRYNPAQDPIVRLAVAGDVTPDRLRWIAEELVEKRLEGRPGIAAVETLGGTEAEIEVLVDEAAAATYGLSLSRIAQRLATENVNLAGGRLTDGGAQYLVRTLNEFQSVDELKNLQMQGSGERTTRLRDVAVVRLGHQDQEVITYLDGDEAVFIDVRKTADANTVTVARNLRERLGLIHAKTTTPEGFPAGTRLAILNDQSAFIEAALTTVRQTAALGGFAALLVLWLFLGDLRSTIIIGLAIPLSIVGTFLPMYLGGISLNLMSLGGLAVGIGMLVDNAIVVLENIARLREEGELPAAAAARGTQEVAGAVTASTLTTCAVFLPIVFVEGIASQIFTDLALTVTASLLTSLLVALLFIPMIASRSLVIPAPTRVLSGSWHEIRSTSGRARTPALVVGLVADAVTWGLVRVLHAMRKFTAQGTERLGPLAQAPVRWWGSRLAQVDRGVQWGLVRALKAPSLPLIAIALITAHALLRLPQLGGELIPDLHQGTFRIAVEAANGTPLEQTAALTRPLADQLRKTPGVLQVSTEVGTGDDLGDDVEQPQTHLATLDVVLTPGDDLSRREIAIQTLAREAFGDHPGIACEIHPPQLFTSATPVEVVLFGQDIAQLLRWSGETVTQLRSIPELVDVRSSLRTGSPEIRVALDRDRLQALGLDARSVADHLRRKIHGTVATRYARQTDRIDVRVRGSKASAQQVDAVRELIINPGQSPAIPLRAVATITEAPGPSEIRRIDQQRAAIVSANTAGRDIASLYGSIRTAMERTVSPLNSSYVIEGQGREMREAFESLRMALGLAIFLVYIVLASQFESLRHPLLILIAIPLAAIGVFEALAFLAVPLSVIVFLGAIVLAGIVVNNAIVFVDAINQERRRGSSIEPAILHAARIRVRPILMTTSTTVLGLLPMTLARGAGAEIQRPLAMTIMAGLVVSTGLTLIVIPILYRYMAGPEPTPVSEIPTNA